MSAIRVTVWNEYLHELQSKEVAAIYPEGIHGCIAGFLKDAGFATRTATLAEPDNGLPQQVLDETDVLFWWGHIAHGKVCDETVQRVYSRVQDGMGLVVLHSGHASKIFEKLMGTRTGDLKWRENNEKQILWCVDPAHPIVEGLTDDKIVLPKEETYGEPFQIPAPDELVFVSWFAGGDVFRSGCCYHRGKGKVFYFQPGHETFPTYHDKAVQRVLINAARWAAPKAGPPAITGHVPQAWVSY